MSKKEIKAAKKLEEKKAKKAAQRAEKKAAAKAEREAGAVEDGSLNGDAVASDVAAPPKPVKKATLEERIKKERPPPRVRVMEGVQPGYVNLRLENVAVTFRNQEVLKDVTWGVQTGDRIGLVGANGGGKTTQLKILNGELEPTTGDVVKSSKDLRVAMLRQEFVDELVMDRTLREEFLSVFEEEAQILNDLRACEKELEELANPDDMQGILDRMEKLQNKADAKEVYNLESRVEKIMNLMGYTPEEGEDLVRMFSGGWKMRIGLGKVLLKDPNVLLLDEPSNHLDLESIEWLEEFLRSQNIPMIIVSHDREFLDQVCTKIVDTDGGKSYEYDGNYSRFLQLKKARMQSWQAAYDAQEKKIKEEKAWVNKFRAKQPDAAKQRLAKIEKLQKSPDYIQRPPFVGKPFKFRFPDAPRMSPEVCNIRNLSHGYGNGLNPLFDNVELYVEKYDRIAILGPNGSGKSTLLRLLMGREEPDEGEAHITGANIVANYFEQNQADVLDLTKTVTETVEGASTEQSYNELRALMGQFLFKGDSVQKKVENLSGGEKSRLSLCCMMLKPANLLILDEPTNHLDIPAKEMLEEALQHFEGSLLLISHDRYFVSKVATTIVAIEDKKLVKYPGDYKFYMDKVKEVKDKVTSRYVSDFKIENAVSVDFDEINKKKGNFGGARTANLVTRKDKGVKNAKRQNR
uniref:ABC transporter domain-containing protein n=1 Tax=Leptocylindrus danicus TaxID=163516 RepID=A0A6U2Q7G8_9STRA